MAIIKGIKKYEEFVRRELAENKRPRIKRFISLSSKPSSKLSA
jgi:hypothetical protein